MFADFNCPKPFFSFVIIAALSALRSAHGSPRARAAPMLGVWLPSHWPGHQHRQELGRGPTSSHVPAARRGSGGGSGRASTPIRLRRGAPMR